MRNFCSSFLFIFLILFSQLTPLQPALALSTEDEQLLNQIQKDTLQYFIRMSDKKSGLTHDSSRPSSPASIAATGFSLAAIAIGASKDFMDKDYARKQLKKTLKTLLNNAHHERGFFYHFLDPQTGKRIWNSEASSIDTAILIAGALLAGQYYPGTEIESMAQKLYARVDWNWMLNGSLLMCMGWTPETGFLPYYWDTYNEHLLIQALALGSPTHPIPKAAWNAWNRKKDAFNGRTVVYAHSGSLFTYQFPQAFIDFRNLNDKGSNYFDNSIKASLANQDYSSSFQDHFQTYQTPIWGLSASLGPGGYRAYGAKPGQGLHDGTIAPYAAISALVFTPEESLKMIRYLFETHQENLYGIFGFKDAFNLNKKWWADEYIGIDQGISILMLENFLSDGVIWKKFGALKSIQDWIKLAELTEDPKTATVIRAS